jgi:hypothetical protein
MVNVSRFLNDHLSGSLRQRDSIVDAHGWFFDFMLFQLQSGVSIASLMCSI